MATRKEAKRRTLIQLTVVIVAVVIIVTGVVLFQNWSNNRPGKPPEEVAITATVGDETLELYPYMSCEPGTECEEGEVPNLHVGADETLVLDIPQEITNHQWQVLTIYDDPAANDEQVHGANETARLEIPGSVAPIEASTGQCPHLQVVEVSSVMIGVDPEGEQAPFTTVWSLSTMSEAERAAATEK